MRKSLAGEWADFAAKIIPANASDVQRVECRRAFYAGAQSMFVCVTGQLDAGTEPTDADMIYMDSLQAELKDFCDDIVAGRA